MSPGPMRSQIRRSVPRYTSPLDKKLFAAIQAKDAALVERLLDQGACANAVSDDDWRPLHDAMFSRAGPEILKLLLARKPDLDALTVNGVRPLDFAISRQDLSGVKMLVEAGASVNAVEGGGWPLRCALDSLGTDEIAAYLVRQGAQAPIRSGEFTPIYKALAWKRYETFSEMLARGWDIEMRDAEGLTPLMQAVKNGHVDMVRLLIDAGADPNAVHNRWETPLWMALGSREKYRDLITELLKGGADIELTPDEHVRKAFDNDTVKDLFNDAARLRREYLAQRFEPFTEGSAAQVPVTKPLRFKHG